MSQVLTDGNDTAFGAVITNDTLYALNGNDVVIYNASSTGVSPDIYGGEGGDFLGVATDGANGDCEIYGGQGSDTGHGGTESDQLNGDDGNDLLVGGEFSYFDASSTGTIIQFDAVTGNDFLYGGAGKDALYGLDGEDVLYGGDGDDNAEGTITTKGDGIFAADYTLIKAGLYGGAGDDYLDGGRGHDSLFGGDDDDTLFGGEGNDDLHGQSGADAGHGGSGNDTVDGGPGDDLLFGDRGTDTMAGGPDNDVMYGGTGDDTMNGATGNDILSGDDGVDLLTGGLGNDILTGGEGPDEFIFDTAIFPAANVDEVTDFDTDLDLIVLSQAIFTDIGVKLNKKEFYEGKKAHDNNDRIVYNDKNGKLFFDHDGKGGDKKVLVAVLDERLDLSHSDFLMVA